MKNKGVSLIVLVITIIVVIILAAAVILTLSNNNPIKNSKEAVYKNDLSSMQNLVDLYLSKKTVGTNGEYSEKDLNATVDTIVEDKNVYEEIFGSTGNKYFDKIYILGGKINIEESKNTREEIEWAKEINIPVKSIRENVVYSLDFSEAPQKVGDEYQVKLKYTDLRGKLVGFEDINNGKNGSGYNSEDKSYVFDGKDDSIQINDTREFNEGITIDITLEFYGPSGSAVSQNLCMKRSGANNGIFMFIGNGNLFPEGMLYIDIGGSEFRIETNIFIQENEKTRITYSFDKVEKGKLYINDELAKSYSFGSLEKLNEGINEILQIAYSFNGKIYSFNIYDKALTEEEIQIVK